MRVEITKRAQRSIERIDTRWRKEADHPEIFRAEMDEVIEHLQTVSSPGTPVPDSIEAGPEAHPAPENEVPRVFRRERPQAMD